MVVEFILKWDIQEAASIQAPISSLYLERFMSNIRSASTRYSDQYRPGIPAYKMTPSPKPYPITPDLPIPDNWEMYSSLTGLVVTLAVVITVTQGTYSMST